MFECGKYNSQIVDTGKRRRWRQSSIVDGLIIFIGILDAKVVPHNSIYRFRHYLSKVITRICILKDEAGINIEEE